MYTNTKWLVTIKPQLLIDYNYKETHYVNMNVYKINNS